MPSISETIQDYETDQIEMIAEQWGIEDDIDPQRNIKKQMADFLRNKDLFLEVYSALPTSEQSALQTLIVENGKVAAAKFSRMYGVIREMGAAIREKERPDRNPISAAENLFYKGIIGLSFFKERREVNEYVFLPQEFFKFLKSIQDDRSQKVLPPVLSEKSISQIISTSDEILDQICFLLAAFRGSIPKAEFSRFIPLPRIHFLTALLRSEGVIDEDSSIVDKKRIESFLTSERSKIFSKIYFSWIEDDSINELRLLPNIVLEGKWKNDPRKTRKNLLDIIAKLPREKWFRISDFVDWMYQRHPDFQRSAGEYDTWFIKEAKSGEYLNGFEFWHKVDGQLLHYLLTGPLFWMGILDLAFTEEEQAYAFKKSDWADNLLEKKPVKYITHETSEITMHKNGVILVPVGTNRELHYQIARFCIWEESQRDHYRYKISLNAIRRAKTQLISTGQIKKLIQKSAKKPAPANILEALNRWNKRQSQINLEKHFLIRVVSSDILDQIEKSVAKRYIQERLSATTATIKSNDVHRLKDALIEMGYFSDVLQEV